MATEAQKRAKAAYRKKMQHVQVMFSQNETDLFEFIKSKENKSGFIKQLLREAMEKEGAKQ